MHEIECPYCGEICTDLWEWEPRQMECTEDCDCTSCGKTFVLTRTVDVYYETEKTIVSEVKDGGKD